MKIEMRKQASKQKDLAKYSLSQEKYDHEQKGKKTHKAGEDPAFLGPQPHQLESRPIAFYLLLSIHLSQVQPMEMIHPPTGQDNGGDKSQGDDWDPGNSSSWG